MKKNEIEKLLKYAKHINQLGDRLREISEELECLLDKEPTIENIIFDKLNIPEDSDKCSRDAHWMTIFDYYSGKIKTEEECKEKLSNMKYDI
jgi:hypothetical protein